MLHNDCPGSWYSGEPKVTNVAFYFLSEILISLCQHCALFWNYVSHWNRKYYAISLIIVFWRHIVIRRDVNLKVSACLQSMSCFGMNVLNVLRIVKVCVHVCMCVLRHVIILSVRPIFINNRFQCKDSFISWYGAYLDLIFYTLILCKLYYLWKLDALHGDKSTLFAWDRGNRIIHTDGQLKD